MKPPPQLPDFPHRSISPGDEEWLERLSNITHQMQPEILYLEGRPLDPDAVYVAVVGSRRPTSAGIETTKELACALAEAGHVVTSGLAIGIDAIAHRTALDAGGSTVAVIGCGLDLNYPQRNETLRRRIRCSGTVLSEYPTGTYPYPHHFPLRNRLIAGLADAVVVVEGSLESGALITGRIADEAGKSVFAVPGSIRNPMAAGPNELIKRSEANLFTSVQDVFDELSPQLVWSKEQPHGSVLVKEDLTQPEEAILWALDDDAPRPMEALLRVSPMPQGEMALALSKLQVRRLVDRLRPGYVLTNAGTRAKAALEQAG